CGSTFWCLVFRRVLFFFSSRRRHTRSKRDWSSDVCSSDLLSLFKNRSRSHSAGGGIASQSGDYGRIRHNLIRHIHCLRRIPLIKIGRASCRERVQISDGDVSCQKKNNKMGEQEKVELIACA